MVRCGYSMMRSRQVVKDQQLITACTSGSVDGIAQVLGVDNSFSEHAVNQAFIAALNRADHGIIDTLLQHDPILRKVEIPRAMQVVIALPTTAEQTAIVKHLVRYHAERFKRKQCDFMVQAVRLGKTEVLEMMLEDGLDPNVKPLWERSKPLVQACEIGSLESVTILVQAGCDPKAKGEAPSVTAALQNTSESHKAIASFLQSQEIYFGEPVKSASNIGGRRLSSGVAASECGSRCQDKTTQRAEDAEGCGDADKYDVYRDALARGKVVSSSIPLPPVITASVAATADAPDEVINKRKRKKRKSP